MRPDITGVGSSPTTSSAPWSLCAVEGLTTEWLQQVADCHLARNAAVGHEMPEMPDCPLAPLGASVSVTSTGTGFAVEIRSGDDASSDILTRARRLTPSP